jgi:hypothetical protein
MTMCLLLSSMACFADGVSNAPILRVSDGARVTLFDIMDDLRGVKLVFLGELHDNANHHQAQLAVIGALKEFGVPVAVGLEMFQSSSQMDLDRWVTGTLTEEAFQSIYYENWTTAWRLYRDIFLYAREKEIPMIGLNVSPKITRQVARKGFASLTPEQLGMLPQVSCRVDEPVVFSEEEPSLYHSCTGRKWACLEARDPGAGKSSIKRAISCDASRDLRKIGVEDCDFGRHGLSLAGAVRRGVKGALS